ncbi:excisionase family DNA-binding protein [Rhodococcus opacus]|uniref:Helix-turn-helix domain-containing protein n=1 Tax=Rhodococcus opacus TaxID=37919 RepID=A0A2S8JAV6_RHOOP|nr:excisionase family DNA-binding protein [Rhodococcus opacus]PQP24137.1 helix-turn-helix domain-containing protein [Rhodococcus opacus]
MCACNTTTQEYASVSATAKKYGVSTDTVRRWIEDDRVEAIRLGPKTVRIKIASLEALITPLGR